MAELVRDWIEHLIGTGMNSATYKKLERVWGRDWRNEGNQMCQHRMKRGWWCSRDNQHIGPCALRPKWWNLRQIYKFTKGKLNLPA